MRSLASIAEPCRLSWLPIAREILDFLDPLLELLCRVGVLESPGEVFDVLLVRSHEQQRLFEGHVFEGRHRDAHHVHRLGHLGLLAHGVHPGRLDKLFLELLQRASSVRCGSHPVLLITLADFTRARTCRNPRSQARGYIAGESPVASSRPALARVPRLSDGRGPTKSRTRRPTALCPCASAGPAPSRPPWPLS